MYASVDSSSQRASQPGGRRRHFRARQARAFSQGVYESYIHIARGARSGTGSEPRQGTFLCSSPAQQENCRADVPERVSDGTSSQCYSGVHEACPLLEHIRQQCVTRHAVVRWSESPSNRQARAELEIFLQIVSEAAGTPKGGPPASPVTQRDTQEEQKEQGPHMVLPDPESLLWFSGASTCSQGGTTVSSGYSPPFVCWEGLREPLGSSPQTPAYR